MKWKPKGVLPKVDGISMVNELKDMFSNRILGLPEEEIELLLVTDLMSGEVLL